MLGLCLRNGAMALSSRILGVFSARLKVVLSGSAGRMSPPAVAWQKAVNFRGEAQGQETLTSWNCL
jgi:hypothetical protein